MILEDKSDFLLRFGFIVWFTTLVVVNIIGYLLSKWQKWNFIEDFSKISIRDVFGCDLCLIEKDKSDLNEDDDEQQALLSSKKYHYVNKNCNNIIINVQKLKNVYFFHSNCTILFLGYLFIKVVLIVQVLSTTCLPGYRCVDDNLNDVCKDSNHTQNNTVIKSPLVCEKYGIASFDSFIVNIGVFTGLIKFIFEINKYVFKVSVNLTLRLSKVLSRRVKGKYLMIIPFLLIFIVISLAVLSLIKVPGQNFVYSDEYYNQKLISCAAIFVLTIFAGCTTANYLFVSKEIKNQLYMIYHCKKEANGIQD